MWSFFSRDPSKDFNFEILELVPSLEDKSVWNLHKGKRKGTSEDVSVFVYDLKSNPESQLEVVKSAVKRLKTLRHPSVLMYLDSLESEKVLYLATEYVDPLKEHLEKLPLETPQKELYIAWGIFQITRALSFLNNDGNLRHNNVNIWSVFVNSSGEWKLGGVEYVSPTTETNLPFKLISSLEVYSPPEKSDPSKQKGITKCSIDMWGLGCLIWEVFNGPLSQPSTLRNPDKIPKQLGPLYFELLNTNPVSRPNPADVITRCRKLGGYFKNDLVDTLLFLEEIQIKDKNEKNRFFSNLTPHLDNFPDNVCKHKILPQLITAFEYGDAGSAVLAPMFKSRLKYWEEHKKPISHNKEMVTHNKFKLKDLTGKKILIDWKELTIHLNSMGYGMKDSKKWQELGRLLDEAEYQKKIVPCVVKLFGSNDRATRSRLLQQLEHFIGHLQASTVNDQIFPQVAHGFMDTNPTIREQTVKSVIHLAPKLSYNNLNVEVLRHFARLQAKDDQGGIRTNTTVCLGKIAQHLHPQIRQKVLISAFIRAMRDPFPPARNAGVLALAATQQYYLLSEVSSRILPALCQLTMDPEKVVRDSVFRTIKGFLGKLEKVSEDPSLRESMEADVNTATPSLSNAAATWAGWAVTAVTAKFYRSQSDTVKSMNPVGAKMLSKPGSLEQPSSSSISTTTSSVTSMTSLEHEDASRGNDSVSDYDYNHWDDNDNWGDMETGGQMASSSGSGCAGSSDPTSPPSGSGPATKITDGWENEEWGGLEQEPEHEVDLTSPSETWSPAGDTAPILPEQKINSTWSSQSHVNHRHNQPSHNWDDHEFEPLEENPGSTNSKLEEARKKREERKLMRQKELEARRASRTATSGGPMKLGAKKF